MSEIGAWCARFWRRSRDWPILGQLGFALLVILVAATVSGGLSNALHGDGGSGPGTTDVVAPKPRTPTSSPSPTSTEARSTTTTAAKTVNPPPTSAPATTSPRPSRLLPLMIATQTHEASYDREADFGGWIGQNGCQDTRAVLLIRTSQAPITFTSSSDCTVKTGRWNDPWSGVVTTIAHDFQIDHTVPLDNAWVSGAWSWTHAQRVAYANDLGDTDHLVAIDASENESKGADGPEGWKPPLSGAWCRYALDWDHIKAKWHLTATPTEWAAVVAMAATC